MAESPVVVLGPTGGQGGAVAAALLARGVRVRWWCVVPATRGLGALLGAASGREPIRRRPAHPTAVKSVHGDRQKTDPGDGVRGARAAPN
jgi:hypothetical protein